MDSLPSESDLIQRLVKQALALPPSKRERFLCNRCASDSIRAAVEAELSGYEQTGSWDGSSAQKAEETSLIETGSTARIDTSDDQGSDDPTLAHKRSRPADDDTPIGMIGEYELLDEIARGGMGTVYKARHRVLERMVAIKIPHASALEEGEERFLREAKSAAALQHANVCPIYEVGHTGQHPFIALQFIEGLTLREWSKQSQPNQRVVAETLAKVGRAVDYAHRRGVIHRDIKPSNIMLDQESGEPMLMDFGLAKQLADRDSEVTKHGQVVGTPAYMAPEQAAGRSEEIGAAVDTYALGAVLYVLLTGKPPFEGFAGEIIGKVQTEQPTAPRKVKSTVHRDLETICLKAMAKQPADRYATAGELADDLDRFSAGEPIQARRESLPARAWRFVVRHAAMLSMAAIIVVALAGVGYFASGSHSARLVADLTESINTGLQQGGWSETQLSELETRIEELAEHDESAARSLRGRFHRAYADNLRKGIATKVTLSEADLTSYEDRFEWLTRRQADLVPDLRAALQRRLRTWQPVFKLSAPFDKHAAVISSSKLHPTESMLQREKQVDNPNNPIRFPILASSPCFGNARVRAVFDPTWKGASEIGLLLHANDESGYLFRVRIPSQLHVNATNESKAKPNKKVLFWHLLSEGGRVNLEILRDGRLLRQTTVRIHDLMDERTQTLTMTAAREGSRVSFTVGSIEPSLVFEDLFPHAGGPAYRYGVWWPPEVGIVSLEASRQPLPTAPSPLERGDELFARRQFDEALSQYREQAGRTSDPATREQARFKEARCLVKLDQPGEAVPILESLSGSDDSRLRLLATCQLWLLHLRQSRYDEAEIVFVSLQAQYDFKQLTLMVPEEDRRDILASIYGSTTGLHLFQFTTEDLAFLIRANDISNLLSPNEGISQRHMRAFQLARGYHVTGDFDQGIQHCKAFLDSPTEQVQGTAVGLAMECSWMLRMKGEPTAALEFVNELLNVNDEDFMQRKELLIERARVHAALEDWDAAAADLDRYLAIDVNQIEYREFCMACLVRGFVHEQQGEQAAALGVWQRGLIKNWLAERNGPRENDPAMTGMSAINAMLVGVMSEKLSNQEMAVLVGGSLPISSGGIEGSLVHQYLQSIAPAMLHMNATKRGREIIRQMAFQEMPLQQYMRNPVALVFLELTRLSAATNDWTPDEEQLVWDLAHTVMEKYLHGEFESSSVVQLMLTWKGTTSVFGWRGIASTLDVEIRGPAAYVFGHRFRRLGRAADAERFFRTALEDADNGSLLEQLAKQQLALPLDGGDQP